MSTDSVFYDRKHNCEVKASQLMPIYAVTYFGVVTDPDESDKTELVGTHEYVIATIGYKSPTCESHRNWDRTVTYADLVFLRFEFTNNKE